MTASAPWTAFPPVNHDARGDRVTTPDEVTVWIGLDVGKESRAEPRAVPCMSQPSGAIEERRRRR
jgi:hypothetical protein